MTSVRKGLENMVFRAWEMDAVAITLLRRGRITLVLNSDAEPVKKI